MFKFLFILTLLTSPFLLCSELEPALPTETNGDLKLFAPSPKRKRFDQVQLEDLGDFGELFDCDYSFSPDLNNDEQGSHDTRMESDGYNDYDYDEEDENSIINFRNRPVKKARAQEDENQENIDPSTKYATAYNVFYPVIGFYPLNGQTTDSNTMDMDMDTASIKELDLKDIQREFPAYPRITSNTATFLYHGNKYSHDHIAIFRKTLKQTE